MSEKVSRDVGVREGFSRRMNRGLTPQSQGGDNDGTVHLLCPHLLQSLLTHFRVRDFNFSIARDWSLRCQWIFDWCLTVLTSAARLAFKQSENLVVTLAGIEGDRRTQCTYSVSVILNGPGTCLSLS